MEKDHQVGIGKFALQLVLDFSEEFEAVGKGHSTKPYQFCIGKQDRWT